MRQNPRMGWDMLRRVETEPSFLENLPDCTHVLPSATSCRRTRLKPSWGKALSARSFHSGQFSCKYSWAETAQDPKSKVLGRSWREHETQLHSTLLNAPELDRPRWTPNCTVATGASCDSMDPQQAIPKCAVSANVHFYRMAAICHPEVPGKSQHRKESII